MKPLTSGILFSALAGALLLSGCAVGNQYGYEAADVGLPVVAGESAAPVGVGSMESRAYVLDGKKPPTFVGLQRGGFGNPFDVTTASGRGFGEDAADVLGTLLQRAGYPVAMTELYGTREAFVAELKERGIEKGVFLNIREWKTDIYVSITLHWDLVLTVLSADGEVLAESSDYGQQPIGAGRFERDNAIAASLALSTKLAGLFNDPAVKAAMGE